MAVREDPAGGWWRRRPWTSTCQPARDPAEDGDGGDDVRRPGRRCRSAVELANVAFEGFLVRRAVVEAIGLPDPSYFIFYDDVDFALRARRAGFRIWAVRDAVLVRQLAFDQQHDLAGWKGFYMYRNLFVVHFRYGENLLVRLKPWLIALAVVLLLPAAWGARGGGQRDPGDPVRAWGCATSPPWRGRLRNRWIDSPGPSWPDNDDPGVCVNPDLVVVGSGLFGLTDCRTLRVRARPQGARDRATAPPRRQRLLRGRPRDRDRDALVYGAHLFPPPTRRSGSTSTGSRRSRATSTACSGSTTGRSTPCR